jgi:two-component system response regulator
MTPVERCRTVLLAEDDDNDVLLIRRAFQRLEKLGQLIAVPDGDQVIPYLMGTGRYHDRQQFPFPDLLILDRRMRALCGLDVLFWLRSEPRFKSLPVLVLSNGFPPNELLIVQRLNAAHALKATQFSELPETLEAGIRVAVSLAHQEIPSGV